MPTQGSILMILETTNRKGKYMKNENISELTNSEYGSWHWFNTLASKIKSRGEFLMNETNSISEDLLCSWGLALYSEAKELLDHKGKINIKEDVEPENTLSIKLTYINNESYDGWPDYGREVFAMIQHCKTQKFENAVLVRIDNDHCEWIHKTMGNKESDGSELSSDYNVKFWGYLPVLD